MADAIVKLSEEDTKRAVAAAVVSLLTPEVMRASLASVLTTMLDLPKYNYGGRNLPPIQELFEAAVKKRVEEEVNRLVAEDEGFRAKVSALVSEAIARLFDDKDLREKMVAGMASAFSAKLAAVK